MSNPRSPIGGSGRPGSAKGPIRGGPDVLGGRGGEGASKDTQPRPPAGSPTTRRPSRDVAGGEAQRRNSSNSTRDAIRADKRAAQGKSRGGDTDTDQGEPYDRPSSSADRRPRTASRVGAGEGDERPGTAASSSGGEGKKGAFGQVYKEPERCAVPGCATAPFKGGMCKVHYGMHFQDLASGGRNLAPLDFGVEKCIVKLCGGDVFKMGYCKEHFSNHERDLVDSVDKELCGEDNPYAKTWGEDPNVARVRQQRQAAQDEKDKAAKEAFKRAMAEKQEFERKRKEREQAEVDAKRKAEDDAEAKLRRERGQKEEEERRARAAELEKRQKEEEDKVRRAQEEARQREKELLDQHRREQADAEDARARDALEAERRRMREEEKRLQDARDEMERAQRARDEEDAARRKKQQEEDEERSREEAERLRLDRQREEDERADQDAARRKEERLRRKEEERLRKEAEVRAWTSQVSQENKGIKDKNRSDMHKSSVEKHLVRDDCLDQDGKALFQDATTYAEAHQQWGPQVGAIEGVESGVLGASEDGLLYRSFDRFAAWEVMGQLDWGEEPLPVGGGKKVAAFAAAKRIDAMTRTASGRYYVVSRGKLFAMDGGNLRCIAPLSHEGAMVKSSVLAMCCSQWLHQKHLEQIFVVLPRGEIHGTFGDTICRLDPANGQLSVIRTTHRTDITAIAAPPLAGGPWHGIVFFYWSRSGGLHGLHWANENYSEQPLGASGPIESVHSLAFSGGGTLYAIGDAIYALDPHTGAIKTSLGGGCFRTPVAFRTALWEPDLLMLPPSLVAYAERANEQQARQAPLSAREEASPVPGMQSGASRPKSTGTTGGAYAY